MFERYPYLALSSSEEITSAGPSGWSCCLFFKVFLLLELVGISIDCLPLLGIPQMLPVNFRLPLNRVIREYIYTQYIQVTWIGPPLRASTLRWLSTSSTSCNWVIVLLSDVHIHRDIGFIALGSLLASSDSRVCSHQLQIETYHHISRSERFCQLCHL